MEKRAAVCAFLVACIVLSMSSARLMAEARNPGFVLPQGSPIHDQRRSLRDEIVGVYSPTANGVKQQSAPAPPPLSSSTLV
uniref:Uncharacterized protein n=1 Tax=Salix viminalis TaxID=40686 RepID=A0A6N2MFG5_SALVM